MFDGDKKLEFHCRRRKQTITTPDLLPMIHPSSISVFFHVAFPAISDSSERLGAESYALYTSKDQTIRKEINATLPRFSACYYDKSTDYAYT
jgi:hypothetical protein